MRKRSTPSSTSTGHTTSRNAAATTRVPSDTLGATFFEAKATAKWPMNTLPPVAEHGFLQVGVDRLLSEPDPEESCEKILPRNRFSPSLAVDGDPRSRLREEIKRDDRFFLRAPDLVHGADQRIDALLQRCEFGLGAVGPDASLESVGELPGSEVAQQRHRYALRPFKREHFGCARFPFGQIERTDV